MFDELATKIEAELKLKQPVVVGISGFGGAGKTTLTERLCKQFNVKGSQVVHLDNIFAADHQNKPIFEDYDWPVITQILKDAPNSERLTYQGRGFYGEPLVFNEPMPSVLILEGVRLYKPEIMTYFDIAVWIDCPLDEATERGTERDRQNGANEAHLARWKGEWEPKDKDYSDSYNPEHLANFLYTEYK